MLVKQQFYLQSRENFSKTLAENIDVSTYSTIFYMCICNTELKGKIWCSFMIPHSFQMVGEFVQIFWGFSISSPSCVSLPNTFLSTTMITLHLPHFI